MKTFQIQNVVKEKQMKTITVHVFDKDSSDVLSRSIRFDGKSKQELEKERDEFFNSVSFRKWYHDSDCYDDLTEEEEKILTDLELLFI